MEALELILFLLSAVALSSILDKFLPRLSLPLVQIALGALIAVFIATPLEGGFDTELLLIMFIAPLHFNESRYADSGALWSNRWGIASLSLGLVVAIVAAVGLTLTALIPAIPLAVACAFGAAMGSTDAVSVIELSKGLKFGRHHKVLLEGEAFFNDVTGTVIFQCAVALAVSGSFSLMHAGEEFVLDLFGGFLGGAVMGFAAWGILEGMRRLGIDKPTLHVTLELLLPFVIYLVAKQIHIGAIISVVIAGMMMSLLPHRHNAQMARQKLQSRSVWDTLSYILNGIIFVILGMQLPRLLEPVADGGVLDPLSAIGVILLVTLVLEAVRFFWVLGMDMFHARSEGCRIFSCFTAESLKSTLAMALAGSKGGITLSLMLTLPLTLQGGEVFAQRGLLISIASGVILCTLLLANFVLPILVPHKSILKRNRNSVDAQIEIIELTIESIMHDAAETGNVKGVQDAEREGTQRPADPGEFTPDEPATVIVMKRYADQLQELMPHASKDVAARASSLYEQCNELYHNMESIDYRISEINGLDNDDDDDADETSSISGRFRSLREVYNAVEDVQAQALARELEIIKMMRNDGRISNEQAKELRNDVYVQQLTL